ncbi:hypothetical protein Q7P37_010444 [Cladosporium fusiforme]
MPPIVHLVRHGQAQQNIDPAFRFVLDPVLTAEGERQSKSLGRSFQFHERIEAVFSSPLQRTLQTALLAFPASLSPRGKIIACPLAQETSVAPCDTGQDRETLEKAFAAADVDFTCVELGWNSKEGQWAQDDDAVQHRSCKMREFLAGRPEREVVLVTHGYFLRYLTDVLPAKTLPACSTVLIHPLAQDWNDLHKDGIWNGSSFANCESRSYSLDLVDGCYKLHETQASLERRS